MLFIIRTGLIQFIEADIVLGTLIDQPNATPQPVMGHPPNTVSDITLESFLNQILAFNTANDASKKGVKLDFKSIEVFQGSLEMLTSLWSRVSARSAFYSSIYIFFFCQMNYPVWINADIVAGPLDNVLTTPVDPIRFLAGAKQLPNAVLSIGWTTRWGPEFTVGTYTQAQVTAMVNAIKSNGIAESGHEITFPVRAGIAAQSHDQLHELAAAINATNKVTFTIWSSANDMVNIDALRKFIFSFGLDKIYVDVPEEVSSRLDLGNAPGGAASLFRVGIITALMVCLSILFSNYF